MHYWSIMWPTCICKDGCFYDRQEEGYAMDCRLCAYFRLTGPFVNHPVRLEGWTGVLGEGDNLSSYLACQGYVTSSKN